MTSRDEQESGVVYRRPPTGNDFKFRLTDAEVVTISSSANTEFEAVALEMSKIIEKIANTVSDLE